MAYKRSRVRIPPGPLILKRGGVPEWTNGVVSKTIVAAKLPQVRILPPPRNNMNEYIFLGALAVLLLLNLFLFVFLFLLKKRIDVFFRSKGKNIEKALRDQIGLTKDQTKDIEKIFGELNRLDKIAQKSFQKIGVVRFNPFKEVGGDQSFSIALLDAENNGFVLTSLYGRDDNRVYNKPIKKGVSSYSLSNEEKEALKKAIGQE